MLIVAEGHPDSLTLFAEMLVPEIESYKEWFSKVDYKLPKEFFEQHGLMLMKSKDLENNNELFLSPNLDEFLYNLNNSLEKEYIASDEQISGREQEQGAVRKNKVNMQLPYIIPGNIGERLTLHTILIFWRCLFGRG